MATSMARCTDSRGREGAGESGLHLADSLETLGDDGCSKDVHNAPACCDGEMGRMECSCCVLGKRALRVACLGGCERLPVSCELLMLQINIAF